MAVLKDFNLEETIRLIDAKDAEVTKICNAYRQGLKKYYDDVDNEEVLETDTVDEKIIKYEKKIYTLGRRLLTAKTKASRINEQHDSVEKAGESLGECINNVSPKMLPELRSKTAELQHQVKNLNTAIAPVDVVVETLTESEAQAVELSRLLVQYKGVTGTDTDILNRCKKIFGDYPDEIIKSTKEEVSYALKACQNSDNFNTMMIDYISKANEIIEGLKKNSEVKEQGSSKTTRGQEGTGGKPSAAQAGTDGNPSAASGSKGAKDFFGTGNQRYDGTKGMPVEQSPTGAFDGQGVKVVTRNMMGNYHGRSEITLKIMHNIYEYFGEDLSYFTSFGFNKNGNMLVKGKIYNVNYIEGIKAIPDGVRDDIQNNCWFEVLVFNKHIAPYFKCIQKFEFATMEQFVEFARQFGIGMDSAATLGKKFYKKTKKLFPSLMDIIVAGSSVIQQENKSVSWTSPISPESSNMDTSKRKPDMKIYDKQSSIDFGEGIGDVVDCVKNKLWKYPIFRVPIKVLGYGWGVPAAFTILNAINPFAVVCGALGIGVLGVLEFKKAKGLLNSK